MLAPFLLKSFQIRSWAIEAIRLFDDLALSLEGVEGRQEHSFWIPRRALNAAGEGVGDLRWRQCAVAAIFFASKKIQNRTLRPSDFIVRERGPRILKRRELLLNLSDLLPPCFDQSFYLADGCGVHLCMPFR